jgi:hypothetical protein
MDATGVLLGGDRRNTLVTSRPEQFSTGTIPLTLSIGVKVPETPTVTVFETIPAIKFTNKKVIIFSYVAYLQERRIRAIV